MSFESCLPLLSQLLSFLAPHFSSSHNVPTWQPTRILLLQASQTGHSSVWDLNTRRRRDAKRQAPFPAAFVPGGTDHISARGVQEMHLPFLSFYPSYLLLSPTIWEQIYFVNE